MRSVGQFNARWDEVRKSLAVVGTMSTAIGLAFAAGAPMIVDTVLRHGRFTAADGSVVTTLIRWYCIGFVANMVVLCAERALLATTRNRRFLQLGVVRALTRLASIFLLAASFGVLVFPFAYAISELTYLTLVMMHFRSARSQVVSG